MIRNDLHVHSVNSSCGLHTIFEIVIICARKGLRLVNVSDHGSKHGYAKKVNFGVFASRKRLPDPVTSPDGSTMRILRGIEANIFPKGKSDIEKRYIHKFDLISAGFHRCAGNGPPDMENGGNVTKNMDMLEQFVMRNPIDILTHPCTKKYPLELDRVVELAVEYGFALEVNNTNLRSEKTDTDQLASLLSIAREKGATLVENSDGHSYHEIGENDAIEAFIERLSLDGNDLFLNRDDKALETFMVERKESRKKRF